MVELQRIGTVRSKFPEAQPADARKMKKEISFIDVDEKFSEGLYKLERSEFIDVIFHFHKSEGYELKTHTYSGDYKGVFATRSPERPSAIGVTTVQLLEIKKNTLKVTGLDAINGTPVLDIKTADTYLLQKNLEKIAGRRLLDDPRKDIMALILAGDTEALLMKAGQLHGHYCPGLAMGIMAATHAMNVLKVDDSDGLEDLLAITETNNCMSDGIQFVTGCTFGNNALIFRDIGKTAFSLVRRDGRGVRIGSRPDARAHMKQAKGSFSDEYVKVVKKRDHSEETIGQFKNSGVEAAFNTLGLDFDRIFRVEEIKTQVPEYAPSHEDIYCNKCGEAVMASRIVQLEKGDFCIDCAKTPYYQLSGHGIQKIKR